MSRRLLTFAAAGILLAGCADAQDPVAIPPESPGTASFQAVHTGWPSPDDPGPPFYARVEMSPPHVYQDDEWVAIVFYRDPGCVRADFNLLHFFDVPAAFACQLTVEGAAVWDDAVGSGGPRVATSQGTGAVPVWFVPAAAIQAALSDGVLTVAELSGLPGLLMGEADRFSETLHPSEGPHPNPKLILNAHGRLDDGRPFKLHISTAGPRRVTSITIGAA